jgi:cation:H+ antiporter
VLVPLLLFLVGILALVAGGHVLVDGASTLSRRLGLSSLVIGLTVVAWGTSAPELAVSLRAALRGQADIALGNVVGSNVVNVLGVIGASALLAPLAVSARLVRLDVPILVGLSAAVYLMALDRSIGRLDGSLLVLAGLAYTVFVVRTSQVEPDRGESSPRRTLGASLALVLGGLLLLALGGHLMVESATVMARAFGVSELVIGLTVVAVGTSLPEAAASVVAAWRGERDIAVGNAIGSNIFNLAAVLGLTALGAGRIAVAPAVLGFDLPVMLAVALVCLPILFTGQAVARWEGALLLGYYAAYVVYLVLASQDHDALPLFSRTMALFVIPLTVLALGVGVWKEYRRRGR